ncbi:MAG: metallophosphoesterase [Acidobacteriia bacterium]|nr:metallophosphoesterase [Terriglobia bacterium]
MSHKRKHPHPQRHPAPKPPPENNDAPVEVGQPSFAEGTTSPDPKKFRIKHPSDANAYKILDAQKQSPRPFPVASAAEPVVKLEDAFGPSGAEIVKEVEKSGQIVFHAVGDTGNTVGPRDEDQVADKMVSDFSETDPGAIPTFFFHLGDVVYSFGEAEYYYDQFYDPFRNYPAPIFAIAGNHDGMVAPQSSTPTLKAFLDNFCTAGQPLHRTPEAGGLVRTAQIQPGVYFTLEAPFVRILALYSNCLEDPGVISDEDGQFSYLGQTQVDFLKTALARAKSENFPGAVLVAVHHPPYVAETGDQYGGRHGASLRMLADIDEACEHAGFWPHAILSGHAHNYQRFTRTQGNREVPFLVAGGGGHAVVPLTRKSEPTLRTPAPQPTLSDGQDTVVFENYDDQDFGYLRILANAKLLRIEYHPASDGAAAKTPDDSVTIDLAGRKIVHYQIARAAHA